MVIARDLTPKHRNLIEVFKRSKLKQNSTKYFNENTLDPYISICDRTSIHSNSSSKSWKPLFKGITSNLELDIKDLESVHSKKKHRKRRKSIRKLFTSRKSSKEPPTNDISFDETESVLSDDDCHTTPLTSSSRYSSIHKDDMYHPRLEKLLKVCPPRGTLEFIMENGLPKGCDIQSGIMEYWNLFNKEDQT